MRTCVGLRIERTTMANRGTLHRETWTANGPGALRSATCTNRPRRTESARRGWRRIERAEGGVARAERELARARGKLAQAIRFSGISAYARAVDAIPSAISKKIRYWESKAEE